jgi:hypothetical protein
MDIQRSVSAQCAGLVSRNAEFFFSFCLAAIKTLRAQRGAAHTSLQSMRMQLDTNPTSIPFPNSWNARGLFVDLLKLRSAQSLTFEAGFYACELLRQAWTKAGSFNVQDVLQAAKQLNTSGNINYMHNGLDCF